MLFHMIEYNSNRISILWRFIFEARDETETIAIRGICEGLDMQNTKHLGVYLWARK